MKVIALGFIVVFLVVVSGWFFSGQDDGGASADGNESRSFSRPQRSSEADAGRRRFGGLSDEAIKLELENLLLDADISTDQYLTLIELLKANEALVFKLLAEREFPEGMDLHDPRFRALEMIDRAFKVHYFGKPLEATLGKMETLRPTKSLFSNLVSTMIAVAEGVDNTEVAYDWIMANGEDTASAVSGTRIGAMLVDYTPEVAWEKIVNLPEGDTRAGALNAFMASDVAGNIETMIEYINAAEDTPDLDDAIYTLLEKALQEDYEPNQLVSIATAPMDPNHRMASLSVLFSEWATNDPESLRAWMEQGHDFTPEQSAEVSLIAKQALKGGMIEF